MTGGVAWQDMRRRADARLGARGCDPGPLWIGFIVLALAAEGDAAPSSCLGRDAASGPGAAYSRRGRYPTAAGLDVVWHAPDSAAVGALEDEPIEAAGAVESVAWA